MLPGELRLSRGIHESLINYGGNQMPIVLVARTEDPLIGMAHGYLKVTGKPLMSLCPGRSASSTPRSKSINAWCDRVRLWFWAATP